MFSVVGFKELKPLSFGYGNLNLINAIFIEGIPIILFVEGERESNPI